MSSIFDLTPTQVAVLGIIIGLAFALPLTVDEQNVFGNVLDLAMQMVFIIAAQRTLIKNALSAQQTSDTAADQQRQLDELTEKVHRRAARLNMIPQPVDS